MKQQLPRFLQEAVARREAKKQTYDGMNRAGFRAGGLQGRRGSRLATKHQSILAGILERDDKQEWEGPKRGSFLTPNRRPAILVSYSTSNRRSLKMLRRAVGQQQREQRAAIRAKQQAVLDWQTAYKEGQDGDPED